MHGDPLTADGGERRIAVTEHTTARPVELASPPHPAPPIHAESREWWERRPVSIAGALGLLLLAIAVLRPSYPNIDLAYALNWGRELTGFESPAYETQFSSTPHPLVTVVAGIASLLGESGAPIALWLVTCAALAASVCLVFLLATHLAGAGAGVVAAFMTATSFSLMANTTKTVADVWVVALILLAVLLAVRRPRCGAPVLLALALAGLHRPEAWVLAAAYWLSLAPGEGWPARVRLGLLAVAAPVVWLMTDLAVTGDALFSLQDTRAAKLADAVIVEARSGHSRAPDQVAGVPLGVDVLIGSMRDFMRLPGLLGGLGGLCLACVVAPRRSAIVVAPALLIAGTFLALGIGGLPLADRFLFPLGAILAVFYGFASLGWLRERKGTLRTAWKIAGCALLLAAVASVPARVRSVERARELARPAATANSELRDLLDDPALRDRLRRCTPVFVPNYRPKPYVAYYLDRSLDDVVAANAARVGNGAFVTAVTPAAREFLAIGGGRFRRPAPPPPGFDVLAGNGSWLVLVRGC